MERTQTYKDMGISARKKKMEQNKITKLIRCKMPSYVVKEIPVLIKGKEATN